MSTVALVGSFGLPSGTVVRAPRTGKGELEGFEPRLALRAGVLLGARAIDLDLDTRLTRLSDLRPESLLEHIPIGRALLALRATATTVKGPLGCIPVTRKLLQQNLMPEELRPRLLQDLMIAGEVDPFDFALAPSSEAVVAFRRRVQELETLDGGGLIDRLLASIKVKPTDESYEMLRGAADVLVAIILTRTVAGARFDRHDIDLFIEETDRALTQPASAIMAQPTYVALESELRRMQHVRERSDIVLIAVDDLEASAGFALEQARAHRARVVAVLADLHPEKDGGGAMSALAAAARARGLPVAMGVARAALEDPTLEPPPAPPGVMVYPQQLAVRLPYGPDTLPVKSFDFVEPGGREGRFACYGNVAHLAALRVLGAFGDGLIARPVTLEHLGKDGEVVTAESLIEPGRPERWDALGYRRLAFHPVGATQRVASVRGELVGVKPAARRPLVIPPRRGDMLPPPEPVSSPASRFLERLLGEASGLSDEALRRRYPELFEQLVVAERPGRARAARMIGDETGQHPLSPDSKKAARWLLEMPMEPLRGRFYSALTLLELSLRARELGVHRRLELELDLENRLGRWPDDRVLARIGDAATRVLLDRSSAVEVDLSVLGGLADERERALDPAAS